VSLAVGGTATFALAGTTTSTGTYTATATADPLGAIPEVDETDNAASAAVTVT
jgi:subtilase family serine protease